MEKEKGENGGLKLKTQMGGLRDKQYEIKSLEEGQSLVR